MAIKWIDLSRNQIHIYEQKHMGGHLVSEHHHQTYQLLFVLEGEGKIRLDGETSELAADDTALIVPYSVHSVMSDSRLTLLVLAFEETALDAESAELLLGGHFQTSVLMKPNLFAGSELRQLLRKMLFEQSKDPSLLGRLSLRIQLSQLLLSLARSLQAGPGTGSNRLRAEKIRSYIDSHYFEPLTAVDIASKLGISTRHVNNIYKERYDMTPMQYLTEVRIRVAQKLLAESGKDIISICFEVGYDSVSTFYRCFKAVAKSSPKTYRELNKPVEEE
ncbi:AraC family transcriptional regulator [Paenibacillus ginsengarvi]|uniref:AraC family transcriptional regulator n=1 Tax=Paenibacillus ginsengarvi TaxID=400777 RepID=A0A3B0CLJ2_9BACL|nr:AraC family transcriptional regulator [Paenibacillus ginsengarvi]RKN85227.1 AraC family transcriptional regulator [Paenibacillus ginsengarvi]